MATPFVWDIKLECEVTLHRKSIQELGKWKWKAPFLTCCTQILNSFELTVNECIVMLHLGITMGLKIIP